MTDFLDGSFNLTSFFVQSKAIEMFYRLFSAQYKDVCLDYFGDLQETGIATFTDGEKIVCDKKISISVDYGYPHPADIEEISMSSKQVAEALFNEFNKNNLFKTHFACRLIIPEPHTAALIFGGK